MRSDIEDKDRINLMARENQRTIDLLETLTPILSEDVIDRDRQMATAKKMRELLLNISRSGLMSK